MQIQMQGRPSALRWGLLLLFHHMLNIGSDSQIIGTLFDRQCYSNNKQILIQMQDPVLSKRINQAILKPRFITDMPKARWDAQITGMFLDMQRYGN